MIHPEGEFVCFNAPLAIDLWIKTSRTSQLTSQMSCQLAEQHVKLLQLLQPPLIFLLGSQKVTLVSQGSMFQLGELWRLGNFQCYTQTKTFSSRDRGVCMACRCLSVLCVVVHMLHGICMNARASVNISIKTFVCIQHSVRLFAWTQAMMVCAVASKSKSSRLSCVLCVFTLCWVLGQSAAGGALIE